MRLAFFSATKHTEDDEDLTPLAKSISHRARKLYSVTDETIYDGYGETTILPSS
jgi:hypothetical protein